MSPLIGNSIHHVKNAMGFVKSFQEICVKPSDLMVGLEVVSMFTRISVDDVLNLL